jgi:hypothetical protein
MAFTAKFFIDHILPDLVAAEPACNPCPWPVLHMDNASPHRAVSIAQKLEENGIIASLHPAFSPNLAPSVFFIFGALKSRLAGGTFESAHKRVEEISEVTSPVPQAKPEMDFLN